MLGIMIGARSGNAKRIAEADVVSGKEQTMSKDIIYREDAIKAIEELPNAYNGWSDAYDKTYIIGTLEEVPKADRRQGEWIPCSERLPKYRELVIITTRDLRVRLAYLDSIYDNHTDDLWDMPLDNAECALWNVVAWMPLPKPYEERKDQ